MHTLTSSQLRMLRALEKWMENFWCNESQRTDSLIFAHDNGWRIHAADCMAGTGATDKRFDRIYSALVRSVGSEKWHKLNRQEANSICDFATIMICKECNSHHFYLPQDTPEELCLNCLHGKCELSA